MTSVDVHRNLIVSLPPKVIDTIEKESQKRDMSKSRFVLRLLEKGLELQEAVKN